MSQAIVVQQRPMEAQQFLPGFDMVINDDPENANKKRKNNVTNCAADTSPNKISKLEEGKDDSHSSCHQKSYSQSSCDPGSDSTSYDSASDSEELDVSQESVSSQCGGEIREPVYQSSEQDRDSPKNQYILELSKGHVFTRLMYILSLQNIPDKMTYNGSGYNLSEAYDEFWETFYTSPIYSVGHETKLPNTSHVINIEVKTLAKVLKRGWQDERYWPKRLARPFLEACLFDINSSSETPDLFLKFIEPSEKEVIEKRNTIDTDVLNIIKKYCSGNTISIADDVDDSCRIAAHEIMVVGMQPIIDVWIRELTGLLDRDTFNFLVKEPNVSIPLDMSCNFLDGGIDMIGHTPPHKLWHTFFLGWPDDKIIFYFRMLNNVLESDFCGHEDFTAKHFLCRCDDTLDTLRLKRHDRVLKILIKCLNMAIKREGPYFSKKDDWKILAMKKNLHYIWPEELGGKSMSLFPHIVAYTLSPKKRALIIEYSISWEFNMHLEKDRKTQKYDSTKKTLEQLGFEVEYRVFILGSRGVLISDLYNLLEDVFGMKQSHISKTLEEISRTTFEIHYKYYKKHK